MIRKLKVTSETYNLIQETCIKYTNEYRKHRKSVTNYSNNGNYQEWQKNKYRLKKDIEKGV